jgi:carbonic anhydrase
MLSIAGGRRWLSALIAVCTALPLAMGALPRAHAQAEESPEQLRQRLAERLKEDISSTKQGAGAKGAKDGKETKDKDDRPRRGAGKSTTLPSVAVAASAARPEPHWSYTGENGPDRWGQLLPEWRQCAIGTRQSPIDIRDTIRVDQEAIRFDYHASRFSVVDNGHTIQVNVSSGNFIEIMGRRFELQQFHFHRPSEERINGRQYDMVAHLVHKDADGRLAVIAVLLERGQDQPLIQTIWNYLPLERGESYDAPVTIDLGQLLPKDKAYFTYMGSLTVPPCSEGVLWMVLRQPVQLSPQQISIFSRLYPMNARPLQAGSGRLIKESN